MIGRRKSLSVELLARGNPVMRGGSAGSFRSVAGVTLLPREGPGDSYSPGPFPMSACFSSAGGPSQVSGPSQGLVTGQPGRAPPLSQVRARPRSVPVPGPSPSRGRGAIEPLEPSADPAAPGRSRSRGGGCRRSESLRRPRRDQSRTNVTGVGNSTVRDTVHNRSCERCNAVGRTSRARSPSGPSGNRSRKVTSTGPR